MRIIIRTVSLWTVLLATGCSSGFLRKHDDQPLPPGTGPSAQQLVDYLNANSAHIRSLTCQDVDLDIKMGVQTIGMPAKLLCEQPRSFRLHAGTLGSSEADIGSNNEEFWFWVKRNDPPDLYYCSYEDLKRNPNIVLPFPFRPEYALEAMGMAEYPRDGDYEVLQGKGTISLVQKVQGANGQPVRKVIVFKSTPQSTGSQVIEYQLLDAQNNKELCSAKILDARRVNGAIVPTRIAFSWPKEKMQLRITLNRPEVNTLPPQSGQASFSRQNLTNLRAVDLARLGLDSRTGVQPAGGFAR